jgi:myo-inositol-1(or 4)-monophosphatase
MQQGQGALTIAIKAARQAGSVILRHINKLESVPVEEKGRNDFVSEVDKQAEAEIIKELKRAFPRHSYLGEESGAQGSGKFQWVIDPLDGTHNYLRGFPHFCTSIALLENGEPSCGVVFDPLRNEIFSATSGRGAFRNERRIRVAGRPSLKDALLVTGFPFRQRRHIAPHLAMTNALLTEAGAEDIRRTGSAALDLAYVACGRVDGYWEIGLHPWDIAAGWLLVREAGGKVSDFAGGDEFMKRGNVIAGNLKTAEGIRAAIAPHLTAGLER